MPKQYVEAGNYYCFLSEEPTQVLKGRVQCKDIRSGIYCSHLSKTSDTCQVWLAAAETFKTRQAQSSSSSTQHSLPYESDDPNDDWVEHTRKSR